MSANVLNYTRCVAIVHGRSEFYLVKYIYTNLHLPVKIISKDKGRGSIQINGLLDLLKKKQFKTLKKFSDEYTIEYDRKTKTLKNFKLFIIMDTDDCDEITKDKYITGDLFKNSILCDYIIPIYNIENLEDVMMKSGIMPKRISDSQKGTYYSRIFPINTEPLSIDTINQVLLLATKIRKVKETNLNVFIGYCYEQATGEKMQLGGDNK